MSSEGWIKLHREIFDSDIWNDVTTFRLFIYLIGKASHCDGHKHKGMTLNKGQYVRSYRKLADDLSYKEGRGFKKYSLSTIRSCVNKLVESERISVKEVDLGTLFTVINYEKYQQSSVRTPNAVDETTSRSPNVNRTEVRTHNGEDETNNDNEFSAIENHTPNTLKEEVRTNAELMPNEARTNAEQYQELKNLRTKELKDSTTTTENDAVVFYQNNIGMIRPNIAEEMLDYINDLGDLLVIESLKRSLDRNKPSWGYAKSILKSWHEKGIRTIEQADAEEVEFKNQFAGPRSFNSKRKSKEVVPDWFNKRNEKQKNVEESQDEESKKRELDKIVAQYNNSQAGGS